MNYDRKEQGDRYRNVNQQPDTNATTQANIV